MDQRELVQVRAELEQFAQDVFTGLPRSDQRATGLRYLRGLMLDGQRKSMQPMAERLGIDYQQLQQFVTSSTWDVAGVRRRVAAMAVELLAPLGPAVWVVDDTGFPKEGKASACVSRQYSGTLGKVANCQIAVSVHAATDRASAMLGARLFVPQSWDETCLPDPDNPDAAIVNEHARRLHAQTTTTDKDGAKKPYVRKKLPLPEQVADIRRRRAAAKIPHEQRYRPKWMIALELLDELSGAGMRPPVLTADAGYGQIAEFRQGLTERDIRYVLAVTSTTTAHPVEAAPAVRPRKGRGPRPKPAYPDPAVSVKDLALTCGAQTAQLVTWRPRLPDRNDPDKPAGELAGHFFAVRVRPAGRTIPRDPGGVLAQAWLLVEWPPGTSEPSDYWLSDLPDHTTLTELVAIAKARWRIEHDYRELKTGLGMDHFEGRSWIGWHRHVTLAATAQLFLTRIRLTNPKAAGQT